MFQDLLSSSVQNYLSDFEVLHKPIDFWAGQRFLALEVGKKHPCIVSVVSRKVFRHIDAASWIQSWKAKEVLVLLSHPALLNVEQVHVDDEYTVMIHEAFPFSYQKLSEAAFTTVLSENKTFSETDALTALRQLTRALKELHNHGVIHRLLHPENILIESLSSQIVLKISFFGLADFCRDPLLLDTGQESYVDWIAPELLDDPDIEDKPTLDIYFLGVLLWRMLFGNTLASADEMLEILEEPQPRPEHPMLRASVKELLKKLIAPEDERFQTTKEILTFLDEMPTKDIPSVRQTIFSLSSTQTYRNFKRLLEEGFGEFDTSPEVFDSDPLVDEHKSSAFNLGFDTDIDIEQEKIDEEIRRNFQEQLHELPPAIPVALEDELLAKYEDEMFEPFSLLKNKYRLLKWGLAVAFSCCLVFWGWKLFV